jgi:hypothetical protein
MIHIRKLQQQAMSANQFLESLGGAMAWYEVGGGVSARTTHFRSLSADLSVAQQEKTMKVSQTAQRTGRDVTATKVPQRRKRISDTATR